MISGFYFEISDKALWNEGCMYRINLWASCKSWPSDKIQKNHEIGVAFLLFSGTAALQWMHSIYNLTRIIFISLLSVFFFLIKSCFDVKVLIDFSPFVYFFYDSGTALIFSMFKNMLTLCSPKSKLPYDATANNNRGQSHIKQQVSAREEPEPCDWQILMQSLIGVWEEACMRVRLYALHASETLI